MKKIVPQICTKHDKPIIHILGCEDCVKESGTTKLEHLAIANDKLWERIAKEQEAQQ